MSNQKKDHIHCDKEEEKKISVFGFILLKYFFNKGHMVVTNVYITPLDSSQMIMAKIQYKKNRIIMIITHKEKIQPRMAML